MGTHLMMPKVGDKAEGGHKSFWYLQFYTPGAYGARGYPIGAPATIKGEDCVRHHGQALYIREPIRPPVPLPPPPITVQLPFNRPCLGRTIEPS